MSGHGNIFLVIWSICMGISSSLRIMDKIWMSPLMDNQGKIGYRQLDGGWGMYLLLLHNGVFFPSVLLD